MKKLKLVFLSIVMALSLLVAGCNNAVNLPSTVTLNGLTYTLLDDNTYEVTAFDNSVSEVTIPVSVNAVKVTSIGEFAFFGWNLTSVTIPDSVTSIGQRAFLCCYGLTSITIPDSVTSIGEDAFNECYKLVEVVNNSDLNITKGSVDNGYIGYYALAVYNNGDTYQTKLSWDNDYVVYTDGTEKILIGYQGENTDLIMPSYITKINDYAFYGNTNLKSITIGDSVTSIGDRAFDDCESLTNITIGKGVKSIGGAAFYSCDNLTKVNYTGTIDDWVQIEFQDNYSNPINFAKKLFINDVLVTKANITTTKISSYAFCLCDSLTSVTIGDSVTSIGQAAFTACDNLTNVTFENTSGWTYVWYNGAICESIAQEQLENTSTAAGCLKNTYSDYYWTRS